MKRIPLPLSSVSQLDQLYATLPQIKCKKKCQNVCGLIEMSSLEYQRIINRTGREMDYGNELTCPLLDRGKGLCKVHDIRPIICRLWGLIDDPRMRCPHGCQPERWLTTTDAQTFFRRVKEISENAGIEVANEYRLGV